MLDFALSLDSDHHDPVTDWNWGNKFQIQKWSSEIVDIDPRTKFHIRLGIKEIHKRRKVQLVITRGKNEFCYEFRPKLDREFKCGTLKVARITTATAVFGSNGKDIVFKVRFGEYLYCSTPQNLDQLTHFLSPKKPEHAFGAKAG